MAIELGSSGLTYGQLERRSNQLAHYLRDLGLGPETTVGLCLDRSFDMVIAWLGVLKAGAAYLPLDPRHPAVRRRFMLQDAAAKAVITVRAQGHDLEGACQHFVPLDEERQRLLSRSEGPCGVTVDPAHRAYVIYTSGSMGRPKGAVLGHRGLANLIRAQQEVFELAPGDRVLQFSPLSFDASLFEMVMALAVGGTLRLAPQEELLPGPGLVALLRRAKISHLTIPPSVLAALPDDPLPDLRQIVVAGEACPVSVVERWAPGRRLFNAYGPTECTIWSTVAECRVRDGKPAIGHAIRGTATHVLGATLQPVRPGEVGELCLAGVGLARGYADRPALTAAAFVPHPFSTQPGERLYRSGDLVQDDPPNGLGFVGRIGHQVKIHGQRIELGEIETVLARYPRVAECAVLARQDMVSSPRLVAYVTLRDEAVHGSLDTAQVRVFLGDQLPHYMVPSSFVVLPSLPLTSHGKVDRDALPAPRGQRQSTGWVHVPPRTLTEQRIARRMATILGVDDVGAEDSFIELGGHSLLATQMVSALRQELQVDIPIHSVLEGATVAELARLAETWVAGERVVLRPMPRDGRRLPLSFSQERIWYVHQINPDSLAYHASSSLIFEGELNIAALEGALSEILRRHELLRTAFPTLDGEPVQVIHAPRPVHLPVVDLTSIPASRRWLVAEEKTLDEVKRRFAIDQPQLVRWTLLRLSDSEHHLVQIEHHLIHDGWSFNVLLGELTELYRAAVEERQPRLPELPIQFVDFVLWQRQWVEGAEAQAQLAFWRRQLEAVPPLELPTDRPRPPVQTFDGGIQGLTIDATLAGGLRQLARRQGATIFMLLFTCFAALLTRWSGQRDFCVGSGVANRRWPETEPLIGMIINNLVLRVDLRQSKDPTFSALLEALRRVTLDAYAHQDVPFDRIVEVVEPERDASRNPLFQVAFSFHDSPLGSLDLPGVELRPRLALTAGSAKFDLNITSILPQEMRLGQGDVAADGEISMLWEYNSALFDRTTAQRLVAAYHRMLEAVVKEPHLPLSSLPLLSVAQRQQMLVEWNDVGRPLGLERLPHQLFEEQARQRPADLALWAEDVQLTYDQVNRRANRLAHTLHRRGLGLEQRVAVLTPGCPNFVVGILAVMKAGGAYLPIDPAYPAERIAFLLADAGVDWLLTSSHLVQALPEIACQVLLLDDEPPLDDESLEGATSRPDYNLDLPASPRQLAYVIYTSGSTGQPKGVQVEHRGLLNLIAWHQDAYGVGLEDRMTQVSSPAFDASVWEIWPYITAGASLYFPGPEVRSSPIELVRYLHRRGITLSFVPTPLAEAMLEETWPADMVLRTLQTAGDALGRRPDPELPFALVNNYGPTENTVAATSGRVSPTDDGRRPSIGRPLSNVPVYVVDPHLSPVAMGAAGELVIGGLSSSRGYLGRPSLTARSFVPDPFGSTPGGRLYRTGDRVRYLATGEIEFLGRLDQQVKVRGFRIELGEVEAALMRHPQIREAVVTVRDGTPTGRRLVAYVVPHDGFDPEALGSFLKAKLPAFMVPDDVVELPSLPLSVHGKLDRSALPAPHLEARQENHVAPRNDLETQIAAFCAELLGRPRVSVEDDFFRLGGNSLLATRLVSRVNRARGTRLPLSRFLEAPSVVELARHAAMAEQEGRPSVGDLGPLASRQPRRLLSGIDQLSAEEVDSLLAELQGSPTTSTQ